MNGVKPITAEHSPTAERAPVQKNRAINPQYKLMS